MSSDSYRLDSLLEITSSKRIHMADYVPSGVPFYRGKEVIERAKGNPVSTELFITQAQYQEIKRKFGSPQDGDILLTSVGTLGVAYFVEGDGDFYFKDGNVTWFRNFDPRVVPKYLYYWLTSPETQKRLDEVSIGSTQRALTISALKSLKVQLPSVDSQKAIVDMLDAVTNRITLLRETNATLEAIAQALFKSWFVDFDPVRAKMEGRTPEGMDEATAALFPDGFETSEFGEVPRGWRAAKFEDFVQRLPVGKKFDQKTAKTEGLVPILDQGKSGVIGFHDEDPGVRASLDEPVVVFANHTCYMRLIAYDFSAIQNVLPFKGKGIDTVWAYYATKGRVKFSEYKGHWPDFTIEKAVVPSMCLGEAFRSVVDPLLRRVRLNEIQSNSLASLRDTLLPRLISGQLRLSDAEMEATAA